MKQARPTTNPMDQKMIENEPHDSTRASTPAPLTSASNSAEADEASPTDLLEPLDDSDSLAGRYVLEAPLGHGFLSTTYRALDRDTGHTVAVKVFSEQVSEQHGFRERLLQHSTKLLNLDHPNVAAVLDAGIDEGRAYLATELVEGKTLRALLTEEGQLSVERAVTIGTQAADGLAQAHQQTVVHGDLKPENVIVGDQGQVKIVDFGLTHLAITNGLLPLDALAERAAYLSPEQVMGSAPNARSDIYTLAVVLYEALTGAPPFIGANLLAVASQRLVREPLSIRRTRREVPVEVDNAILHALAPNPLERYGSATEFRASLLERELALQASALHDTQATTADRPMARPRRTPFEQFAVLAPALATVAVGIIAFLFYVLLLPNVLSLFQFTEVPELTGRSLSEAAQIARAAGLDVTVESIQPTDDKPKDTVISQVPASGESASRASPVKLIVSSGIRTPDLRRMSLNDGRAFLIRSGWPVGAIQTQVAQDSAPGTIVGQTPAAGELLADKRELTLVVAAGNYAEGAQTTASAGENPGAAVDGNEQTSWSAGGPAPQWIEIDLKVPIAVGGLELVTWQEQEGPTIHEVWVSTQDGKYFPIHTFRGMTSDGQKLTARLDEPPQQVVRIKVHTSLSAGDVGWREIRVLAGQQSLASAATTTISTTRTVPVVATATLSASGTFVVVSDTGRVGLSRRHTPTMSDELRTWRDGTRL